MENLETIPTELAICGLTASGEKRIPGWLVKKPSLGDSSEFPNVRLENCLLWAALEDMHIRNMSDTWCQKQIAPFAKEFKLAMEDGDKTAGILTSILEDHGVFAWHSFRRVWDLHLAYNAVSSIGGVDTIVPKSGEFGLALRNATFRLFYITIFKDQLGRALWGWKKRADENRSPRCRITDDIDMNHYQDMLLRIQGEHRMIDYLNEAASEDRFEVIIDESKLGDALLTTARCELIARFYHQFEDPDADADGAACVGNAEMLAGVAARIVDGWETMSATPKPTIEDIVKELGVNMLKAVKADERMLNKEYLESGGYFERGLSEYEIISG